MPENILGTVRFNRIDTSVCKRVPKEVSVQEPSALPAAPAVTKPTPVDAVAASGQLNRTSSTASLHSAVCQRFAWPRQVEELFTKKPVSLRVRPLHTTPVHAYPLNTGQQSGRDILAQGHTTWVS